MLPSPCENLCGDDTPEEKPDPLAYLPPGFLADSRGEDRLPLGNSATNTGDFRGFLDQPTARDLARSAQSGNGLAALEAPAAATVSRPPLLLFGLIAAALYLSR